MRSLRAALIVILCIGVLLVAGALYGIDSPFVTGHYGYHGGEYGTRARNTLRHGSILPVNEPTSGDPRPEQLYLHHPVLTHHLVTLTMTVLGDHEYAVRAAGLLACIASFVLFVRIVWVYWGPVYAAIAAAVFTLAPINVWFANLIDPGYPSIAALLGFFICYFRWLQSSRWRDGAWALVFAALAGFFEWSPYLAAVPIAVHVVWTGLHRRGRYLRFVPLYAFAVAAPMAVHWIIAWRTGHIAEMRESYGVRTVGGLNEGFYELTRQHAAAMFGVPLLLLGGAWLLVIGYRAVAHRLRPRDLVGISFAFALIAYVHIFRQGALIHGYRYLYGGIACAIAAADVAEMLRARAAAAIVIIGATIALTIQPAARALIVSRQMGGSPFLLPYDPAVPKVAFAQAAHDASDPGDVLYIDPSFAYQMETVYYLDRDIQPYPIGAAAALSADRRVHALLLCAPAALSPSDRATLASLAQRHPVWVVSGYALVDLRRPGPELVVERAIAPGNRGWLMRYLEGPYEYPVRVPDDDRTGVFER